MEFETPSDRRLRYIPPRQSIIGIDDPWRSMFTRPITVDGRSVGDVLDYDWCYVVVEVDGSKSSWAK